METEIWKDIPGYEGLYQVSSLGRVKSLKRNSHVKHKLGTNYIRIINERILKPKISSKKRYIKHGYFLVVLYTGFDKDSQMYKEKYYGVHQLVAMSFLGHKPDGTTKVVVDHIDNNSLNNRLDNLQLITNRENLSKDKKGTSKFTGARWHKRAKKWCSAITINKKQKWLGSFDTELEASEAYQNALKNIDVQSD